MKDDTAQDAVTHFSDNAAEFHSYYRDNPEFHERLDVWRGLLDRYAPRDGLSLDMGCGSGVFTFYLAARSDGRVIGVDGAAEMVALCEAQRRQRGVENVRFVQARLPSVDEVPLANADLLISSSVIEYVDDLPAVLALFARLLAPGSTLIVSMPNRRCINRLYERLKFRITGRPQIYEYILHFSTPQALARRVRGLDLELLEAHYYNHATRLARLTRRVGLPAPLTEDLFVAVFRKS